MRARIIGIAPTTFDTDQMARMRSLALGETDPETLAAANRVRARLKARREAQGERHRYPGPAGAVKATVRGPSATELAQKHDGDPWALAAAIGARVEAGDGRVMRGRSKPIDGFSVRNPVNAAGPHLIVIADDAGDDRDLILLHEIGHIVLPADATEDDCDAFALEFMLAAQMRR